jgi:hypothetical protein
MLCDSELGCDSRSKVHPAFRVQRFQKSHMAQTHGFAPCADMEQSEHKGAVWLKALD